MACGLHYGCRADTEFVPSKYDMNGIAVKILIPLNQEKVMTVGITGEPLPHLVDQVVQIVKEMGDNV